MKTLGWIAGILTLGLGLGAWAGPTHVAHTPPVGLTMGEAVPVEVRVDGVPDGEPLVLVNYRVAGSREYASQRLEALGGGRYAGAIPSVHTRAIGLVYYIEVNGPGGAYTTSLGAAEAPLRLALEEPTGEARRSWIEKTTVLFAGLGGVALLVWLRERRQRLVVMEQIFWVRTLLPLLHLSGPALTEQVTKLAGRPLPHPAQGMKTFSRKQLLRRLNEVRRLDLAELTRARDRFLGPEWELPSAEALERQRRFGRQAVARA